MHGNDYKRNNHDSDILTRRSNAISDESCNDVPTKLLDLKDKRFLCIYLSETSLLLNLPHLQPRTFYFNYISPARLEVAFFYCLNAAL